MNVKNLIRFKKRKLYNDILWKPVMKKSQIFKQIIFQFYSHRILDKYFSFSIGSNTKTLNDCVTIQVGHEVVGGGCNLSLHRCCLTSNVCIKPTPTR